MKYLLLITLAFVGCGSKKTHEQSKNSSFGEHTLDDNTTGTGMAVPHGKPYTMKGSDVFYTVYIESYGSSMHMDRDSSIVIIGDTMALIKQTLILLINKTNLK